MKKFEQNRIVINEISSLVGDELLEIKRRKRKKEERSKMVKLQKKKKKKKKKHLSLN